MDGIAGCRCVRPTSGIGPASKPNEQSSAASAQTSFSVARISLFMCRRTSTATWSLRERPVWIFLPRSPSVSVSSRSTAMWTSWSSSRMANFPSAASRTIRASSLRTRAASAFVTIGLFSPFISESIVTCAAVPMQSHFASARSRTGSSPTV